MKKIAIIFILFFLFKFSSYIYSETTENEPILTMMMPLEIPKNRNEYDELLELVNKAKQSGIRTFQVDFWVLEAISNNAIKLKFVDNNPVLYIDEANFDSSQLAWFFNFAKEQSIDIKLILSYHTLEAGVNVGDTGNIKIPFYLKNVLATYMLNILRISKDELSQNLYNSLPTNRAGDKYFPVNYLFTEGVYDIREDEYSRPTKYNYQYFAPWLTPYLSSYYELIAKFVYNYLQTNNYKDLVYKVVISGGPASEFRLLGYGDDTDKTLNCCYPNFGEFQGGPLAKIFFREYLKEKYDGDYKKLFDSWGLENFTGKPYNPNKDGFNTIDFPSEQELKARNAPTINKYWMDLFSFLNRVNLKHLDIQLSIHKKYFNPNKLLVKFPGVYWSLHAQGFSGLLAFDFYNQPIINDLKNFANNYLYEAYEEFFKILAKHKGTSLAYTAGEIYNGYGESNFSVGSSMLEALFRLAGDYNIPLHLENALIGNLSNPACRRFLYQNALKSSGLTILRLPVLNDPIIYNYLQFLNLEIKYQYVVSLIHDVSKGVNIDLFIKLTLEHNYLDSLVDFAIKNPELNKITIPRIEYILKALIYLNQDISKLPIKNNMYLLENFTNFNFNSSDRIDRRVIVPSNFFLKQKLHSPARTIKK